MIDSGTPGWLADAVSDLMRYTRGGDAGRVTPWVRALTGRDPIAFEQFAADHASSFRREDENSP
jgi:hypothetical protein